MVVADIASNEKPFFQPFVKSQIESIEKLGHEIEIFNLHGTENSIHYLTKTVLLKKLCRKFKPDIVHSHYSFCAISALVSLPVKQVVSYMGSDIISKGEPNLTSKIKNNIIHKISKIPVPFASAIVVKTEEMAKEFSFRGKVHIVPNGVDFEKFKPIDKQEARKKLNLDLLRKIILFPGNVKDPNKNFSLANQVFEKLQSTTNLKPEIICFRDKSPEELRLYYNACDVLLFTSFSEGSPNVVKEALACNMPVVTVPVGDTATLLQGVKNSYLCNYNADELANSVEAILVNGSRSNGRECVKHLEIMEVAKRIENIYTCILGHK